jgi:hypothetical protein
MLWANQALRDTQPAWWESLLQQQLMAVDTKGVPRYNSLLMAQWLKTLLGQAPSPNDLPTTHYQLNMPEITGAYPPAEDASNCGPWTAQVQALHPAAVR